MREAASHGAQLQLKVTLGKPRRSGYRDIHLDGECNEQLLDHCIHIDTESREVLIELTSHIDLSASRVQLEVFHMIGWLTTARDSTRGFRRFVRQHQCVDITHGLQVQIHAKDRLIRTIRSLDGSCDGSGAWCLQELGRADLDIDMACHEWARLESEGSTELHLV